MSFTDPPRPRALRRLIPAALLLAVAVAGAIFFRDLLSFEALARHREALLAFRDAHYLPAVLAFVAAYVAIVAFSLPGATVATLAGGFLFGLFPGVLFNLAGASAGAILIFLAVRAGFGEALAARIEGQGGTVARLRAALAENEWEVLFLMRVTPVVPFFVANLLPALLNISLPKFALTTVVGIVPGALVLTSIGSGLGEVFETGGVPDLSVFAEPHVAGPIVGLVLLGVLPILIRTLRKRDL
ncbi:MAG: hypothetical protein RIR62_2282 [Pseudomonadota bacterium]